MEKVKVAYELPDPAVVNGVADWGRIEMLNKDKLVPIVHIYYISHLGEWRRIETGDDVFEGAYQNFRELNQDNFTIQANKILSFSKCTLEDPNVRPDLQYSWEYKENNIWRPFTRPANDILETAYNNQKTECQVPCEMDNEKLWIHITLNDMTKWNTRYDTQPIRRNPFPKTKVFRLSYGWYWQGDNETWNPYPIPDAITLETAYTNNELSCLLDQRTTNNQVDRYVIKLSTMSQHLQGNEIFRRLVKRVGPKVERIPIFTSPAEWKAYKEGLNEIPPSSPIFTQINDYLNNTIIQNHETTYGLVPGTKRVPTSFKILKLFYNKREHLWTDFQDTKKKLNPLSKELQEVRSTFPLKLPLLDSNTNEAYLFHGTSREVIDKVIEQGFLTRFTHEVVTGSTYNGMFGHGAYFAERSSKSNQYVPCPICKSNCFSKKDPCYCSKQKVKEAGGYCMVLARVLLGNCDVCKRYSVSQYKELDRALPGTNGIWAESKDHFGSCTLKYREFVVYDSGQVYPEYLIYYERE